MSKGYWIKGYPYTDADKANYHKKPVIHRFDTEKEAIFFASQVANGRILDWGAGSLLNQKETSDAFLDGKSYHETCKTLSEYEEMEKDDDDFLYGRK